MWLRLGALLLLAALGSAQNATSSGSKVLCYYDGSATLREGLGKVTVQDIELALPFCTHLVYGYAGINKENNNVRPLNEQLELDSGKGLYRVATSLKRRFPKLKVLLGIGGYKDVEAEEKPSDKYLNLLETGAGRIAFVNSVYSLVKTYDFDGIDLAWQFPQTKPKRIRNWTGKLWHKFKKIFTGDSVLDAKAEEHKEEFTDLVRQLKDAFLSDHYQLGLTVLPHVNETMFMDMSMLHHHVDYIHLASFDQQTPERNPWEADYTAPIYELNDRVVGNNLDSEVKLWQSHSTPANKLIVGIPTYARGWKLVGESGVEGIPPLKADGPSPPGPWTNTQGFLSWGEVCAKLPNPANANVKSYADRPLRKVADPTKRFGVYAFKIADENDENGSWVSYEDPETAGNKAAYVKAKGLGGIAIVDLDDDDFKGVCAGDKFPILRASVFRL